ncbi:MarR family transcriptional regulator [Halopenitus sp. H-Gu1]|uniref:MarR family transcriptional regulator n=1 Tax=Halopenitus sp. H-Gu1 TaxID=3242697 RepID=UPI00359DA482
MVLADERILEFLDEHEVGTAKEMAESNTVRFSRSYITQRSGKLVDYGLIRLLGNGVFVITEVGEQYLEGELDAQELESDGD